MVSGQWSVVSHWPWPLATLREWLIADTRHADSLKITSTIPGRQGVKPWQNPILVYVEISNQGGHNLTRVFG
ncbi:MAG: hypothetical protein F6K37_24410, partial [Moorea sp. SIO4E2]